MPVVHRPMPRQRRFGRRGTHRRQRQLAEMADFAGQGIERQGGHGQHRLVEVTRFCLVFLGTPEAREQKSGEPVGKRPDEEHAEDVEDGVEQRQLGGRRRIQPEQFAHGTEQAEQPGQQQQGDDTGQHVEQNMRCRRALGIRRGANGGEQGRYRGADVGADNHGSRRLDAHQAALRRREGNHQRGRRGLHQHGHQDADKNHGDDADRPFPVRQPEIGGGTGEGVLEQVDAKEEHAEASQCRTQCGAPGALAGQAQQHAKADQRQREDVDAELHADQGDQPAGHRRPDVGAEQHPQGLAEGEQAGIDEADGGHRHRARRLHGDRHQCAGGQAAQAGLGGPGKYPLQRRPGGQLEAVGHQPHAEQEEADTASQTAEQGQQVHGVRPSPFPAPDRVEASR